MSPHRTNNVIRDSRRQPAQALPETGCYFLSPLGFRWFNSRVVKPVQEDLFVELDSFETFDVSRYILFSPIYCLDIVAKIIGYLLSVNHFKVWVVGIHRNLRPYAFLHLLPRIWNFGLNTSLHVINLLHGHYPCNTYKKQLNN
jgi:hypothetical protein